MPRPPSEDAPEPEFDPDEPLLGGPGGAATSDSRELPAFRETPAAPSTVYIVESDPLYRRIFARVVAAAGYEVRAFSSPAEFLSDVGPERAGCLLFAAEGAAVRPTSSDERREEFAAAIRGPSDRDITPAELLARLAASRSPLAAVAVTASLPFDPALALLGRGAVDVLAKPVKRDDLVAAVREAIGVSASRRDRREAGLRLTRLSDRQYRLLGLLASGWPRWLIALRLGVRFQEVRSRAEGIVRILGVASVAEAAEIYRDPDFARLA